jgi:hypothetical protein
VLNRQKKNAESAKKSAESAKKVPSWQKKSAESAKKSAESAKKVLSRQKKVPSLQKKVPSRQKKKCRVSKKKVLSQLIKVLSRQKKSAESANFKRGGGCCVVLGYLSPPFKCLCPSHVHFSVHRFTNNRLFLFKPSEPAIHIYMGTYWTT